MIEPPNTDPFSREETYCSSPSDSGNKAQRLDLNDLRFVYIHPLMFPFTATATANRYILGKTGFCIKPYETL